MSDIAKSNQKVQNKRLIIYLYVLAASKNPDAVECVVPFRVDENEIFFGPCKKGLRKKLRKEYLSQSVSHTEIEDDIYLIGVNGSNDKKIRKIVYVGKVSKIMTFEQAYNRLVEPKYKKLRELSSSPLHLRPLYDNNKLIGYQHISTEHLTHDAWIDDLLDKGKKIENVIHKKEERELLSNNSSVDFPLDCCMLLDNIFWADKTGKISGKETNGIDIDEQILSILKEVQMQEKPEIEIDKFAIFGYNVNHEVFGKTGSWLEVEGMFAEELINVLYRKIDENNS